MAVQEFLLRTPLRGYPWLMAIDRSRRGRAARKRKRRMGAVAHDLSDAQWSALKSAWAGCAYCGADDRALQKDCVQPLSRGGRYTLDNIVPACRSCNASKSNSEVTGWMRRKKLNERTFLERLVEVRAWLPDDFAEAVDGKESSADLE